MLSSLRHNSSHLFSFHSVRNLTSDAREPLSRDSCKESNVFCEKLSKVKTPFNPIKAFFDVPNKARSLFGKRGSEGQGWTGADAEH